MKIEDYLNRVENHNNYNNYDVKNEYIYYNEINEYNISYDKKELLYSMYKYIRTYTHEPYSDFNRGSQYAYIQSENLNGKRIMIRFNLMSKEDLDHESYFEPNHNQWICRSEFEKRMNKYRRIGSSRFSETVVTLPVAPNRNNQERIYFSEDGYIFVNDECAKAIENVNIDTLGFELVKCIETLNYNSKHFNESAPYNDKIARDYDPEFDYALQRFLDKVYSNNNSVSKEKKKKFGRWF